MVILAMHIGSNRSAKRNESSPRRDRRKKTARQKNIDQLRDSNASLASQQSGLGIEREHPIQPRQINDAILIVKRRIPISPPRPPRNQRGCIRGNNRPQLRYSIRPINIALGKRIPAPSSEQSMARMRRRGRGRRHNKKSEARLKLTGRTRARNARDCAAHQHAEPNPTSPQIGCWVPRNLLFASSTLLRERSRLLTRARGKLLRERRPAARRR